MIKKRFFEKKIFYLINLGVLFGILRIIAKKKADSIYENEPEQKNPMEGKHVIFVKDEVDKRNADGFSGHLEIIGNSKYHSNFYEKYIKRILDIIFSFVGLVVLAPFLAIVAIVIYIDDPGPVLFTQKRVGRNKQYFKLHKFRTMKISTPHDVPTHMLGNPDQYITKIGRFLRQYSIDELVQIWDIFLGNMSIIGPRPALWNQDKLIALRDEYGANSVRPGLTGLAQINGRDELDLKKKAELDGEYTSNISFFTDLRCFFETVKSVLKHDGVVEGGNSRKSEI